MAFAENQLRLLAGKLPEKNVKTRAQHGMTLSYIEGWHAIAEANRIFGFDGWDRETVAAECVWQDGRGAAKLCAYTAKVRIRVRAGDVTIQRDGSGVGQGSAATLGEAHESALKEAETDATKRALTTFGNLFGLALYDREQAGVRRGRTTRLPPPAQPSDGAETSWQLLNVRGELLASHDAPQSYCTALRQLLGNAQTPKTLAALWLHNGPGIDRLRAVYPELKTGNGTHYADVLLRHYERTAERLSQSGAPPSSPGGGQLEQPAIDKSLLLLGAPRRVRDEDHRRFIGTLPCLVCGRAPTQAHHLRFAQPRSMASKVSDEWTVPLCFLHHRALHDIGNEEAWWAEKGIDAKGEALRLWRESHGTGEAADALKSNNHSLPPAGPTTEESAGEPPAPSPAE